MICVSEQASVHGEELVIVCFGYRVEWLRVESSQIIATLLSSWVGRMNWMPQSWSGWNSIERVGNDLEIPRRLLVHRMGRRIVIDVSDYRLN